LGRRGLRPRDDLEEEVVGLAEELIPPRGQGGGGTGKWGQRQVGEMGRATHFRQSTEIGFSSVGVERSPTTLMLC
jgi:hypothetical protein